MYLLDVDTLEHVFKGTPRVSAKLLACSPAAIRISTCTIEEILLPQFSEINKGRSERHPNVGHPSFHLVRLLNALSKFTVHPYNDEAERLYWTFTAKTKRVGKADCRLAAHAIVDGLIVVTCNHSHFEAIQQLEPEHNLRVENWAA